MHEIYKMVSLSADGKPRDFRLTKLDAAGGFCIVCTGVTLQKVPDRAFDRTGTNLTYTLLAATITEQ